MRTCTCPTCNAKHSSSWEEAFLREGFFNWEGNPYIDNVAKPGTGVSLIKETDWPGMQDPRDLLDAEIIKLLDEAFPDDA